jgi:hypothetical protein
MCKPNHQLSFSAYWDCVNEAMRGAGEPVATREEAEVLYEASQPTEDAASIIIDQRRRNAAEEDRADRVYWENN